MDAARVLITLSLFLSASFFDFRERRVPNPHWWVLGAAGFSLLETDLIMSQAPLKYQLFLIPMGTLAYEALFPWDRDDSPRAPLRLLAIASSIGVLAFLFWQSQGTSDRTLFSQLLATVVMMLLAHIFYAVGLLRGGADAKAFLFLALIFPHYPALPFGPMFSADPRMADVLHIAFPFPLVVLLNAVWPLLVLPLGLLIWNGVRGNLSFPRALLGFKVPLDRVPRFSWLMERPFEEGVRPTYFAKRDSDREADIARLRELGVREVWVTPQIPFLIPLAIGVVLSLVLGNPILWVISR